MRLSAAMLMVCLSVVVLTVAAPCAATTTAADAVANGKQGLAHFEARRYQQALERFEEADRLMHSPVFVLYVARCKRHLGALLAARAAYSRVIAEQIADDAPPLWRDAQLQARSERVALNEQIPTLRVTVEPSSDPSLSVRIDGQTRSSEQLAGPIDLNPGEHSVELRRDGETIATRTFVLKAGGSKTLTLAEAAEGGGGGMRIAGWTLLGLGGAGVVVGSVLGGMALSKADEAKSGCVDGLCPPEMEQPNALLEEDALALAHGSTAGLVIGGAAAAVGISLLIIGSPGSDAEQPELSASLRLGSLGLGSLGFSGSF